MRRVGVVLCVGALACGKTPTATGVEQINGSYAVDGLDACAHRPLVILDQVDAWSGSVESLPSLTVYEDGLVITAEWDKAANVARITSARADSPKTIADDLERQGVFVLAPRIDVSKATDQPETSIRYRIGGAWRSVTVVGFRPDGDITAKEKDPPPSFVAAFRMLRALRFRDARPLVRSEYLVTLTDSYPAREALANDWPAGVPAPPALVPDERYLGRPRTYLATGDAGAALHAFVRRERNRPAVKLPSGERLEMWVTTRIPDQSYIDRVDRCASWEAKPYHECKDR